MDTVKIGSKGEQVFAYIKNGLLNELATLDAQQTYSTGIKIGNPFVCVKEKKATTDVAATPASTRYSCISSADTISMFFEEIRDGVTALATAHHPREFVSAP